MPEIQEELWELIIQACVSDLRFLAMLGYDPDIRDVLEDPVLMDSKYLEESPLLPGEIALVVVNDKKSYLQKWDELFGQSADIVEKMQPDKSILFTQLTLDFKLALSSQSDDEVYYFLYLQTPKTLCIVVLNMTFSKVLAVTPVIPELHTHVLDILGDSVIKSAEDFEKMKKLAV